eukprot:gene7990-16349_t
MKYLFGVRKVILCIEKIPMACEQFLYHDQIPNLSVDRNCLKVAQMIRTLRLQFDTITKSNLQCALVTRGGSEHNLRRQQATETGRPLSKRHGQNLALAHFGVHMLE